MESVSKIKNNLAFDALISFEQDDAVLAFERVTITDREIDSVSIYY